MKNALVLFAHPFSNKSRVNRAVMEALQDLPCVRVHDLYEEYPYFHIKVDREQELLLESDLIIWQHPLYWFSMPPLMKLWCDEVLRRDFAFGPDGSRLQGKDLLLSVTTGGLGDPTLSIPSIQELFLPYQQIAKVCGLNWRDPLLMQATGRATNEEVQRHAEQVRRVILGYCENVIPEKRGN